MLVGVGKILQNYKLILEGEKFVEDKAIPKSIIYSKVELIALLGRSATS